MAMIKKYFKKLIQSFFEKLYPSLKLLRSPSSSFYKNVELNVQKGKHVKVYEPFFLAFSSVGDYTYIAENSFISRTTIGKFCSIGPKLFCGYGIHPTNGISTHPMFYSTSKQNGISLSKFDKIDERKEIVIGNDVFIGANVTILDGVIIGDGAVIGAGSVVSKDIPAYAIAVGSPIRVIKYRFSEEIISDLIKYKWWNSEDDLIKVEKLFFDVSEFIKIKKNDSFL